jgi:mono/diheme cytochrome c family protein
MRFYVIAALVLVPLAGLFNLGYGLLRGVPEPASLKIAFTSPARGPDLLRGQALYRSRCYGCHVAPAHLGPALDRLYLGARYAADEAIWRVVRAGRDPMPAFTEEMLDDRELADIIAYLRAGAPP